MIDLFSFFKYFALNLVPEDEEKILSKRLG